MLVGFHGLTGLLKVRLQLGGNGQSAEVGHLGELVEVVGQPSLPKLTEEPPDGAGVLHNRFGNPARL